tara:strand:- start:866 stop:1042 length:177 start_codon:yes stop_codon:yes gene_type:complete
MDSDEIINALIRLMDAIAAMPPYEKGVGWPDIVEEDEGELNKAFWNAQALVEEYGSDD